MTKREYLQTLDVKKLVKNGLLPVTMLRDINLFDAVSAFDTAFEKGLISRGDAMDGVARTYKVSGRTVRKVMREMRATIV